MVPKRRRSVTPATPRLSHREEHTGYEAHARPARRSDPASIRSASPLPRQTTTLHRSGASSAGDLPDLVGQRDVRTKWTKISMRSSGGRAGPTKAGCGPAGPSTSAICGPRRITNHRTRFYFTEEGWQRYGRRTYQSGHRGRRATQGHPTQEPASIAGGVPRPVAGRDPSGEGPGLADEALSGRAGRHAIARHQRFASALSEGSAGRRATGTPHGTGSGVVTVSERGRLRYCPQCPRRPDRVPA